MAASQDNAFQRFLEALDMADTLLELDRLGYRNPPRPAEQSAVMGLRGGAAVLMVAAFEAYLRDLFEEKLSLLTGHPLPVNFDTLPNKIQENSVFGTLERAMKGRPFEEPSSRFDRIADIELAIRHVISKVVNPGAFSETGGNPNSKRVNEMFKAVGVGDIYIRIRPAFDTAWAKSETHDFIQTKLDEIIRRRHTVAHTAQALNISRRDLREAVKFLRILAQMLDREFSLYITQLLR